jgi:hypothetical protein
VDEISEWKIIERIQIPRGFKYIKFDANLGKLSGMRTEFFLAFVIPSIF